MASQLLNVRAGKRAEVRIDMPGRGDAVEWDFLLESGHFLREYLLLEKQVTFGIKFLGRRGELVPVLEAELLMGERWGKYKADVPGTLVFTWDNTHGE